MPQIKNIIEENTLDMEVIVNPKVLDGGLNVIQLETAVGAAMKCFEGKCLSKCYSLAKLKKNKANFV